MLVLRSVTFHPLAAETPFPLLRIVLQRVTFQALAAERRVFFLVSVTLPFQALAAERRVFSSCRLHCVIFS